MSEKNLSASHGRKQQEQQRGDGTVELGGSVEEAIDRELNRLFKDFWEDTDPAKILAVRRKRDIHRHETAKAVDSMTSNLQLHFLHSNS